MGESSQRIDDIEIDLSRVIGTGDPSEIDTLLAGLRPGEEARAISELEQSQQTRLFESLGPERSAELLLRSLDRGAPMLVEQMPPDQAAVIVEEMPSRQQVDLLRELKEKDAEQIIGAFAQPEADKGQYARPGKAYRRDAVEPFIEP